MLVASFDAVKCLCVLYVVDTPACKIQALACPHRQRRRSGRCHLQIARDALAHGLVGEEVAGDPVEAHAVQRQPLDLAHLHHSPP